jgi:hypothetical protein
MDAPGTFAGALDRPLQPHVSVSIERLSNPKKSLLKSRMRGYYICCFRRPCGRKLNCHGIVAGIRIGSPIPLMQCRTTSQPMFACTASP